MSTKARITSEFPTPEEVASRLRVRPARAAQLRRQLFELHVTQPDGSVRIERDKGTARFRAKKK